MCKMCHFCHTFSTHNNTLILRGQTVENKGVFEKIIFFNIHRILIWFLLA